MTKDEQLYHDIYEALCVLAYVLGCLSQANKINLTSISDINKSEEIKKHTNRLIRKIKNYDK